MLLFTPALYFLWPLVFTYAWLKWFFWTRFRIPFTLNLFRFTPELKHFSSSLRSLHIPLFSSLLLLLFSFFLIRPNFFFWCPVWIFSLLAQLRFEKKAKAHIWKFENEECAFFLPVYPTLRKTLRFKGMKRFSTSLEKPDILFIFLESFRAKNVGCLSASLGFSPHFDAWAKKGLLFTKFHTNGLQTFRAMLSSLFGIPVYSNTMSLRPFCSISMRGLPEILKEKGYKNALFQGGYTSFDWTFPFFKKHGFDTIIGRENLQGLHQTSWGVCDEALFDFTANWLEQQTEPTFASIFTISNHHPWDSPIKIQTPEHLPSAYRRYLQTFAYSDQALGHFLERLQKSGRLDKSIVFIMGDHGQEMGERHTEIAMHNDLHEENIHIPLLILGLGVGQIDEVASQVDLLPTVLDLLDLSAVHHSVGRSLLRASSDPIFFCLQKQQIGLLQKDQKILIGEKKEQYDLSRDPDEKSPVTPTDKTCEQLQSYFQSVEKIEHWIPPQLEKVAFELKPKALNDEQWLLLQKTKTASPILDFSECPQITDRSILEMDLNHLKEAHEINLTNCALLTDKSLQWIGSHCNKLALFEASHCPLITDQGVEAILNGCNRLFSLKLEGNDELINIKTTKTHTLNALHLKDCHNLTGNALLSLARTSPYLNYLAAAFENVEERHFQEMAQTLDQLICLWLENSTLPSNALNAFFKANRKLSIVILENFSHIDALDFSTNLWMNTLKLVDCPNANDETLFSLEKLSLQNVCLHSCPKITAKGLERLIRNTQCKVIIQDCPLIQREEIQKLREAGLNIY